MILFSKIEESRNDLRLVLPEPQYHALLCVHWTNRKTPKSHCSPI